MAQRRDGGIQIPAKEEIGMMPVAPQADRRSGEAFEAEIQIGHTK
jgi:hypothetical protein